MAPRAPAAGRRRAAVAGRGRHGAADGGAAAAPAAAPAAAAEAEEGEAGEVGGDGEAAGARGRTLRLEFVCITAQDLLAVKTDDARPSLLTHLLEDDSGLELPAAAAAALTSAQQRETIVTLLPARPYLWAQQLGAAADDAAANGGGLPPSIAALQFFGRVMSALRERSHARDVLERWLTRLATADTAPLPDVAAPPAPPLPPRSALAGVEELAADEAAAAATLPPADAWRATGRRCFVGEVTRRARRRPSPFPPPPTTSTDLTPPPPAQVARGDLVLGATVQIFADFPRARPRVALAWVAPPARARRAAPAGCARSRTRGRCGWRRRTRRRRATTTWC